VVVKKEGKKVEVEIALFVMTAGPCPKGFRGERRGLMTAQSANS